MGLYKFVSVLRLWGYPYIYYIATLAFSSLLPQITLRLSRGLPGARTNDALRNPLRDWSSGSSSCQECKWLTAPRSASLPEPPPAEELPRSTSCCLSGAGCIQYLVSVGVSRPPLPEFGTSPKSRPGSRPPRGVSRSLDGTALRFTFSLCPVPRPLFLNRAHSQEHSSVHFPHVNLRLGTCLPGNLTSVLPKWCQDTGSAVELRRWPSRSPAACELRDRRRGSAERRWLRQRCHGQTCPPRGRGLRGQGRNCTGGGGAVGVSDIFEKGKLVIIRHVESGSYCWRKSMNWRRQWKSDSD